VSGNLTGINLLQLTVVITADI